MDIIKKIRAQAKAQIKTIILPEYEDSRTQEASRIIGEEGFVKALLLTPDKISPQDKERYIEEYYQLYQTRDVDIASVRKLFEGTLYYAAMMAREGKVDGFIAGATHTTAEVARCAIRCLGVDGRITIATGAFIMSIPNSRYGEDGVFIFADCGIIPEPNSRQLACIAFAAADLAVKVLKIPARIALLSYSTKGSAKGKGIDKITEALSLIKEMAPHLLVDGEMQVDAAIVSEVARIKYPDSPVAGRANVLIFPSLEAGNIGYKLVERLANAQAIGPLLLGLNKPCSDLSRGCSAEDIVNCTAVTAIMAQQ